MERANDDVALPILSASEDVMRSRAHAADPDVTGGAQEPSTSGPIPQWQPSLRINTFVASRTPDSASYGGDSFSRRPGRAGGRRKPHASDNACAGRFGNVCLWPVLLFAAVFASSVVLVVVLLTRKHHTPWSFTWEGHQPRSIVRIQVQSHDADNAVTVTTHTTATNDRAVTVTTRGAVNVLDGAAPASGSIGEGGGAAAVRIGPGAGATGGAAGGGKAPPGGIPPDFDLQAYLKWNPEVVEEGVDTLEKAHAHYLEVGRAQHFVYKDFEVTLRYTACGGCMNQQYSHVAALVLACMSHSKRVVWPAMQERESFNNRYHPNAAKNTQRWHYLDATTLFDLPDIQRSFREKYGIEVIKHPDNPRMPDMTHPETAFQTHAMDFMPPHAAHIRYTSQIYIGRHNPQGLARSFMDAGRQSFMATGRHPTTLLVDLPCTLFMIDTRGLGIVEDIAKLVTFSPAIHALADKVIAGVRNETGQTEFNGIHLRMEKDAADWARIIGPEKYWKMYKAAMWRAGFVKHPHPLYVASGLLKASKTDAWSKQEMERLSKEILARRYTNSIVYKERYLSRAELDGVSNEQSGLIDFLVMLRSSKLVAIGVSTFSFYLSELRIAEGRPPEDTTLVMLSYIGTDELFFSAGLIATRTRLALDAQHRLPDVCRKSDGSRCFTPGGPGVRGL